MRFFPLSRSFSVYSVVPIFFILRRSWFAIILSKDNGLLWSHPKGGANLYLWIGSSCAIGRGQDRQCEIILRRIQLCCNCAERIFHLTHSIGCYSCLVISCTILISPDVVLDYVVYISGYRSICAQVFESPRAAVIDSDPIVEVSSKSGIKRSLRFLR